MIPSSTPSVWDWISSGLEILAIALSPLIALQISARIESSRDEKNRKLWALQTLMATRHAPFADDRIRALNMIEVLFRNETVRDARRNFLVSLSKTDGVHPDGTVDKDLLDEWNERQWELVSAMAGALGIPLTRADFDAGYAPKALNAVLLRQALADEMTKSLIMFARKNLGLRWLPADLFKYPDGTGVIGEYEEHAVPGGERDDDPPADTPIPGA